MRLLPGYRRVEQSIGFADEFIHQPGAGDIIRDHIASATGNLLTEALRSGDVDTTMPIYVDGKQRMDFEDFLRNNRVVKVSLDYAQRQQQRQSITSRLGIDG